MKRVVRELLLEKLSPIVCKDEDLDRISKRYFTTREATGFASQVSQIMTQVRIGTFNRVSFAFVFHRIVNSRPVENCVVTLVIITVVIMILNNFCQHVLKLSATTLGADLPGKNAACFSVDKGQNIDPVFFSSMKVKSSSISTV